MQLKLGFFILLFFSAAINSNAQTTDTIKRLQFQSLNQVGVLGGSGGEALQLQTINGVRSKWAFLGAGVGLDGYYIRSIPLFLHVSVTTGKKNKTPFFYADGGYNIAWKREKDFTLAWGSVENTKGGAYYEFGLGYLLPAFKNSKLLLSAGYSYKQLSQTVTSPSWRSIQPPSSETSDTYRYYLRRIAIKAGILF